MQKTGCLVFPPLGEIYFYSLLLTFGSTLDHLVSPFFRRILCISKKKNIHRVIVFDIFQIAFSFQQQQQEDERLRDQENLPKGSTVASSMNSVGNTSASTTDRIGKRHAFLKKLVK